MGAPHVRAFGLDRNPALRKTLEKTLCDAAAEHDSAGDVGLPDTEELEQKGSRKQPELDYERVDKALTDGDYSALNQY